MISLAAKDEDHLKKLSQKLIILGVNYTEFKEPDIGNQVTAIASLSGDGKEFSNLPLLRL